MPLATLIPWRTALEISGETDGDSERYMIKIPTTSAGVHAAQTIKKDGIQSLGTALFSVPQAIAASQADMLAISPYFNGQPPRTSPLMYQHK